MFRSLDVVDWKHKESQGRLHCGKPTQRAKTSRQLPQSQDHFWRTIQAFIRLTDCIKHTNTSLMPSSSPTGHRPYWAWELGDTIYIQNIILNDDSQADIHQVTWIKLSIWVQTEDRIPSIWKTQNILLHGKIATPVNPLLMTIHNLIWVQDALKSLRYTDLVSWHFEHLDTGEVSTSKWHQADLYTNAPQFFRSAARSLINEIRLMVCQWRLQCGPNSGLSLWPEISMSGNRMCNA